MSLNNINSVVGFAIAAVLGWGGLTLVAHTEDIASAKTNFEYIKEDISEIKVDIEGINDSLKAIEEKI